MKVFIKGQMFDDWFDDWFDDDIDDWFDDSTDYDVKIEQKELENEN